MSSGLLLAGVEPACHVAQRGAPIRRRTARDGFTPAMTNVDAEWRELLLAGRTGDAAAYRRLLKEVAARLRAFLMRRLDSAQRGDLEDIVQEILIAIHRHADSYDASKPVSPWVYAIARYKLIDYVRRTRRMRLSVPLDAVAEFLAAETIEDAPARGDLASLLSTLPPKQQAAIRGVKIEERSVRETAAATGMSESAVKVSIHRGVKRLIDLVGKRP